MEEEINYEIMRYELDNQGYILNVFFGCYSGMCEGYTGSVPEGYDSLEEWFEENCETINAWKIQNGNLVYDENRCAALQEQFEIEAEENTLANHKYVNDKFNQTNSVVLDEFAENETGTSLVVLEDSGDYSIPKIKVSSEEVTECTVISSNKNLLGIDAVTSTINGVTITINADGSINLNGTATADIEFDLKGTSTNLDMLFLIQLETNYVVSGLTEGVSLSLYNYDGTDKTLIGTYNNESFNLTTSEKVTQSALSISSGSAFNNVTINPQIELGTSASDFIKHDENKKVITLKNKAATLKNELNSYSPTTILMSDEAVELNVDYFKYKSLEERFTEIEATADGLLIDVTSLTDTTKSLEEQLENGVEKVKNTTVTITAEEGLVVGTTESGFNAQINSTGSTTGMTLRDNEEVLAEYTKEGTKTKDLELFGVFRYGKDSIEDTPMFISQLYTDENGEEGFGHFYNGGE